MFVAKIFAKTSTNSLYPFSGFPNNFFDSLTRWSSGKAVGVKAEFHYLTDQLLNFGVLFYLFFSLCLRIFGSWSRLYSKRSVENLFSSWISAPVIWLPLFTQPQTTPNYYITYLLRIVPPLVAGYCQLHSQHYYFISKIDGLRAAK